MNCLAHAYRFLDDGHFAAGTCIPDWLGMIDRSVRVRKKSTAVFLENEALDPFTVSIATGIAQHLNDDDLFHGSRAFVESSLQAARMIGGFLDNESGHRTGFLGHIVVELLLDAEIERRNPGTIQEYYRVIGQVPPARLQSTINRIAARPTTEIGRFMERYLNERFLFDYLDDGRLLYRLNRIMGRVGLEPLPADIVLLMPEIRDLVDSRFDDLLQPVIQNGEPGLGQATVPSKA